MYVCVYIYIHTRMCVCIYIYTHTQTMGFMQTIADVRTQQDLGRLAAHQLQAHRTVRGARSDSF